MTTKMRSVGVVLGTVGLISASFASTMGCDDLVTPSQVTTDGGELTNTTGIPIDKTDANNLIVTGKVLDLFGGKPVNWVVLDPATRKMKAFKWTLPLRTIESVPAGDADLRYWTEVPKEFTTETVFEGMSYDFLPHGHAPPGVYTFPHWEFHLITTPQGQAQVIDCRDPTLPSKELLPVHPSGWFVIPPPNNCVPGMGIHAVTPYLPELSQQRFTKSISPAYYGGRLTSIEIKITQTTLSERKSFDMDVPDPPTERAALYPKTLHVEYDGPTDTYVWSMSEFVQSERVPQ